MPAAWVTIVLLLLGLPLLAWWLGGRRFWGRLESRSAEYEGAAVMRRHGLTGTEAAQVVDAVTGGRALEDPRQRAAAVELAQLTLDRLFPPWEDASLGRRIMLMLSVVWVGGVAVVAVFRFALGGLGNVNWLNLLWAVLLTASPLWQSYRLRRAIALNTAPGAAPEG